jgi:hypothetical protein
MIELARQSFAVLLIAVNVAMWIASASWKQAGRVVIVDGIERTMEL